MRKFNVTGMTCAACSARVESAVKKTEGVTDCSVNLLTGTLLADGNASDEAIKSAVLRAGYGIADPSEGNTSENDMGEKHLLHRLIASVVIHLPLLYLSLGHAMLGFPVPFFLEAPSALALAELLLAVLVMVVDRHFFISGTKALYRLSPNMNTLVSLGCAASFIYSTVVLFGMIDGYVSDTPLYFETCAMILTLVSFGKYLEARAKGKTTSALDALSMLSPDTACVERDGKETVIKASDLRVGDIFLVRPGERIPADGIVLDGGSSVDESSLTGESAPRDKTSGDSVSTPSVNLSGFLRCRAERVGTDTSLAAVIRAVEDAGATKAPIARLADTVAGFFVPTVLGISLVTAVIWLIASRDIAFALERAVSVLVISCPCALGLATPVAVTVGCGVGAKNGILFKTASALETAGRIRTVCLDKTGTVTVGSPRVTHIEAPDPNKLLHLAACLEAHSEHPYAKAVCEYAAGHGVTVDEVNDFSVEPGRGLTAALDGKILLGGSAAYVGCVPEKALESAALFAAKGETPLYFSVDGAYAGCIFTADTEKKDSASAVRYLKEMGLRVVMISGDNERTAKAVAEKVGIETVYAGVLPVEKADIVKREAQGGRVMMVGDGINDAPSLAAADLGAAVGTGTDIAVDSADVVLMKNSLTDAANAVKLGRAVLRSIRQNLFWAFFYNCVGIPVAAGALAFAGVTLDPIIAAAAMSLSSVCVVTNALRLGRVKLYENDNEEKKIEDKETKTMKKTMKIEGMMCVHCEARVKKVLEALPQVTEALVSHETGTAELTLCGEISDELLKKTVEEQGYTVL